MVSVEDAVIARIEKAGVHFELMVDPGLALDFRKGKASLENVLAVREVADYTDEVVITRLLEMAERDPDLEVRCASISAMGNYIYLGGVDLCDPESELAPVFFEDCLSEPDLERFSSLLMAIKRS